MYRRIIFNLVEHTGLEPVTPRMQIWCSPNWTAFVEWLTENDLAELSADLKALGVPRPRFSD